MFRVQDCLVPATGISIFENKKSRVDTLLFVSYMKYRLELVFVFQQLQVFLVVFKNEQ